jgi:hypothetical protein
MRTSGEILRNKVCVCNDDWLRVRIGMQIDLWSARYHNVRPRCNTLHWVKVGWYLRRVVALSLPVSLLSRFDKGVGAARANDIFGRGDRWYPDQLPLYRPKLVGLRRQLIGDLIGAERKSILSRARGRHGGRTYVMAAKFNRPGQHKEGGGIRG